MLHVLSTFTEAGDPTPVEAEVIMGRFAEVDFVKDGETLGSGGLLVTTQCVQASPRPSCAPTDLVRQASRVGQ